MKEFSEMGHQMLLTEFYLDRPLLPWQQTIRQNGLYLGLYNKYHQDVMEHVMEVRVEGLAVR